MRDYIISSFKQSFHILSYHSNAQHISDIAATTSRNVIICRKYAEIINLQITNVPVANIITTKPLTIAFIMFLIFICINPFRLAYLISSKFLRFPVSSRICSCADGSRHTCLLGICRYACKLCTGYLSTIFTRFQ